MKRLLSVVFAMMFFLTSLTGCIKPYKTPIIETIATDEDAILVPLVGGIEGQEQADTDKYVKEDLIYTKEVEIPQRWVQTGRFNWNGEYRPSAKLIIISRAPESREWVDASDEGTSTSKQGFDVESKDSIGFSFGVVATAQVTDTVKYANKYGERPLTNVMDAEIRNYVQSILSDVATSYTLDEIDKMKVEAVSNLRAEIIPTFAEFGITVTSIGFKGGLTYEDPEIQKAFNDVIVAEKSREAQLLINEKEKSQVETANSNKIAKAQAEAEEARIKAQNWEVYYKIRQLDIQEIYAQALLEHGLPNTMLGDLNDIILNLE